MFVFLLVDIHIETNNGLKEFGSNCGMDITGRTSMNFKIKACNDASILLGETGTSSIDKPSYIVHFGTEILQIQSPLLTISNFWSGLNCSYYVDLWISWSTSYQKFTAGTGSNIGEDIIGVYIGSLMNEHITYVEVASNYQAYWILDLPENSKNGKYKYYMRKHQSWKQYLFKNSVSKCKKIVGLYLDKKS